MSQFPSTALPVTLTQALADAVQDFKKDIENRSEALFTKLFELQFPPTGLNTQPKAELPHNSHFGNMSANRTGKFGFTPATDKQIKYLNRLVSQEHIDPEELERQFQFIASLSKQEANQMIGRLLKV